MLKKTSLIVLGGMLLILGGCGAKKQAEVTQVPAEPVQASLVDQYRDQLPENKETVEIDLDRSVLRWSGQKTVVDDVHPGTIKLKFGELYKVDGEIVGGQFTIDMDSMQSDEGLDRLINHLKNEDFFDVPTHPEARFAITLARDAGLQGVKNISGDLTIKGLRNNIQFPAFLEEVDGVQKATAQFKIDRTLWGIKYGSGKFFKELGDKVIDDMIEFELEIYTK